MEWTMVTTPIATKDLVLVNMKVNAAECLMLGLIATVLMFSSQCVAISCTNNPCLHGGTCADSTGSIDCTCDTGYGGDRCELAPKCTDSTACENGGTCKADTNTDQHICFCAPGFGGDLCADVSCINNPCLNEGTCNVESGAIDCTCAPGWGGDRCADASGAATISGHFLLLTATVVAVLAKLNLS